MVDIKIKVPDWIYNSVIEYCNTSKEPIHLLYHKYRFLKILNEIMLIIKPGIRIENIDLSIFNPMVYNVALERHAGYASLPSRGNYVAFFKNPHYNQVQELFYYISSQKKGEGTLAKKFDIILFYETLENPLCSYETVIKDLSCIIKIYGMLICDPARAAKAVNRFKILLGRNIFRKKGDLANDISSGYRDMRGCAVEVKDILLQPFWS